MRRSIAKFLGVALILGLAITARYTVGAFSSGIGEDKDNQSKSKLPFDPYDRFVNSHDFECLDDRAGCSNESDDVNPFLLRPEVFNRLSSGGQRAALFINGRLPAPPSRIQPSLSSVGGDTVSPQANPGDNIRVNNPSIDEPGSHAQSESCVAVNGINVIVGFNDDTSTNFNGYGFSTDGGNTFTHKRIPNATGLINAGDPVVAFGPSGELYYSSLVVSPITGAVRVGVAKSMDNGATFTPPVSVGVSSGVGQSDQDKEWIAVDTNANSRFKGNLYISLTALSELAGGFIAFSRSTDGGKTFDPLQAISPQKKNDFPVQGSMPTVAPDGTIYVAFEDDRLSPGGISIVKSVDGGKTFSTPKLVATAHTIFPGFVTGGGSVRTNSFPSIAVDKNNPSNVYVVYDAVPTNSPMDRADVFFVRSTDGANTFSAPRRLNDDNTTTTQLFPSIAIAADGTIGVRWSDRRNDPINDSLADIYMTTSTDGGNTFSKNFRVTDNNWAFGPIEAGLAGGYHGDYDQLAASGNNFYISWSDERNGDPDVYFTFLPSNRNPNAPDFNISAMKMFDNIIAGSSIDFDLSTSGANGFSGSLSLNASPAISGLTYNFASPTVTTGQSGKLTISTTAGVQPGTYLITVTATGPGSTRKTEFRLSVLDPTNRVADPPINATKTPGFSGTNFGLQIDANGTLHLVFDDDTAVAASGGAEVFYKQSVDGGKTYSTPIKVSTNAEVSVAPSLTLDSAGNIYIVWTSLSADQMSIMIFFSKSTDGGKTFSSPVLVSGTARLVTAASAAVDKSGNILVIYSDLSQDNNRLFAARSVNGGTSFSNAVQISADTENVNGRGAMAFDSKGAAYVVYDNAPPAGQPGVLTINLAIAADGQSFTPAKAISDARVASAFFPHIAIDKNDNIYVTFYFRFGTSPENFNREIMLIKSTSRGSSFSSPVNVSNNPGQSFFPYVIPDNKGNVNIAWEDTTGNDQFDIFFARSTDGGSTFSQPINLSGNSGLSVDAFGAADSNGNVFVGWIDDSPANDEVFIDPIIFFKAQPPTINSISPTSGAVGSDVTILGSNFQGASAVIFSGNASVPTSGFTVSADGTQIATKVPQGAQTGPITVVTPLGTAMSGVFTVTAADFALSISPGSQSVAAGASTSFTVSVQAIGNFTQAVSLSASLAPSDGTVTTSFSPSSITPGSNATLTVSTQASTQANTFTITVTGTGGQIARTKTVTVNVVAPDFSLAFNPASVTVSRGQKGQFTVLVNRTGGFSGNVTVTAPNTTPLKIKLTPPSQSTTGASVSFSFKIKKSAPTGTQQLMFTGRDDSGRVRTGTLTVVVQ